MKKTHSIKTVVAIGIGAAIFVVLSRFASIPSGIPNTSLETAYAVLWPTRGVCDGIDWSLS